jgi:ATP-dependent RNA helicase DDX1
VQLLLCTDVAARGLDVSGLPFVINYTLPSEPATYLHRIGRVGRSDHLGLAISLVGCGPEKVWFHKCRQRGSGCTNRKLTSQGGCCIWFDELDMVRQIEEHVDSALPQCDESFEVPPIVPGVRYGERIDSRTLEGMQKCESASFEQHRDYLTAAVADLSHMEETMQTSYLSMKLRWRPKSSA